MTLSSSSSSSYLTALAAGLGVGLGVGILALLRSPRRGRRNVKAQHVQVWLDASRKPATDGYRMPAEWEPHERTWMCWPTRQDNWRASAGPAQSAYAAVANAISQFEPVTVCVPQQEYSTARAMLNPERITVVEMSQDDAWVRDTGPTFLVSPGKPLRGVDWEFNAWGGLYSPCNQDRLVAAKILDMVCAGRYSAPFILEGGSIHVDGEGTVLTTEECLLNANRNPNMTREDIERELESYLGVQKIIWLEKGLYGDEDTNGHIDNICCFVKPGEVALHWTDDQSDPQHAISLAIWNQLSAEKDACGRQLKVHKVTGPPPLYYTEEEIRGLVDSERKAGDRLAASYMNFYIANGGVIMPGFGVETDATAFMQLSKIFPDHKVVQVATREILLGGGNIHCITQQMPLAD